MKTLAVILHYNTPELTSRLYQQLKPFERSDYKLAVLDNGSPESGKCQYASYRTEENIYFGGGLNLAMQLVLDSQEYDSLLFLNSDLIVQGYNFVKTLRREMFRSDYKLLSPTIIQPGEDQCYWPTMHCWNSNTVREVPWVDFQCPLLHRDLIEEIKQFDDNLIFGWGNDIYSGIVCEDKSWKVGVVDYCPVVHLSNETVKQNQDNPVIRNYNTYANQGMMQFFTKIEKLDKLVQFREAAKNYKYEE